MYTLSTHIKPSMALESISRSSQGLMRILDTGMASEKQIHKYIYFNFYINNVGLQEFVWIAPQSS